MAVGYNPSIVSDGLVLYLDSANSRSYSGSGNTWYDLSRSSNTSALTNGASYVGSGSSSYISFDGSNDYVAVNSSANILSKTEYTKTAYIYVTSFSTSNNIISGGNTAQHAFWLFGSNKLNAGHNGNWNTVVGSTTLSLNRWYFCAVSYSDSSGWKLYLNGTQDGTSANTTTFTGSQFVNIGSYDNGNNFTGRIAGALIYNRVLSAAEILQNFNATRFRYGI